MGLLPVCMVGSYIKVIVKDKIIEVSTISKVDNIKGVIIRTLLNGIKDDDSNINNIDSNKVTTTKSFKKMFLYS